MNNDIFPNKFKAALAAHQIQIGCWSALASPITTEVLGLAGFDWLVLDGEQYPITAVGSVARQNLDNLGHVTVIVDGQKSAYMHGAIHVEGEEVPRLEVGSTFVIEQL